MTRTALRMLPLLLVLASACASKPMTPDELRGGPLAYLEEGRTTREAVVLRLGTPTTDFEKGRILTYRITEDRGNGGIAVRPRQSGMGVPQTVQAAMEYSLVLIFDEKGVLTKQSLVPMK